MIIEIKNIPTGSKIKTVEFKIELEPQQNTKDNEPDFNVLGPKLQVTTEGFGVPTELDVKPNTNITAPEFEITTESFPPRTNIPQPPKPPKPPKEQISSENVTQPFKEIPKEMLEMDL